ncbi:hypothetical protein NECAME_05291 [Necator americanus]|uniref:Uncharacterized protein n=1 Tax=Necator americanus TaxID=51031 RepID=W2SI46_NECAM|nr:hypothetical protein NECAME_05291 [Necator americanus]ETN69309.1 hypothetical protein NECAME_05291 [Necator americanus]
MFRCSRDPGPSPRYCNEFRKKHYITKSCLDATTNVKTLKQNMIQSTSNKSRKSKSLKKRDTCISKASFARILRNVSCRERAPSKKLRWNKHAAWALQIVKLLRAVAKVFNEPIVLLVDAVHYGIFRNAGYRTEDILVNEF